MTKPYQVLTGRIRQELADLEIIVNRAERAMTAATKSSSENKDLFIDSVALSLHDFYTGLERIFSQIATVVDGSMPAGREWHRDLLNQMGIAWSDLRPQVLSTETISFLDEYRRFRHVVRNVYAFEFELQRIEPLIGRLRQSFTQTQSELLVFADFLARVACD
ncbi:MAG: hypothetical protein AB4352_29215 [Hormoscilla sp.]